MLRILKGFKEKLSKTRETIAGRLEKIFLGKKELTEDVLDQIEEVLFTSDIGPSTAEELISRVKERISRKELNDTEKLKQALKEEIIGFLEIPEKRKLIFPESDPLVILMVGVNGVGKTTTIGKIAYMMKGKGKKVLLVAADTFRAAAIDQLRIIGEKVGADIVKKEEGADPSSVVFDALDIAKSKKYDVVIIDTAGRLHTKKGLMEELKKIKRVCSKKIPGSPHETWLVLDATIGQNSIYQAKEFKSSVGITGIILAKLDGTAKGGVIVGICHQLRIPVLYVGIGEGMEDIREFDPEEFAEAILS